MAENCTFIIITAGNCPHCVKYKKTIHNELLKQLKIKFPKLTTVIIDLPSMQFPKNHNYHPDIIKYVSFYPTFLLANKTWNNHTIPLEALIFNASRQEVEINGNKIMKVEINKTGLIQLTAENMLEWIKGNLMSATFNTILNNKTGLNLTNTNNINKKANVLLTNGNKTFEPSSSTNNTNNTNTNLKRDPNTAKWIIMVAATPTDI